jgi:hypothetical protein
MEHDMGSINMNGTLLMDVASAGKALVEVIHTLRKTSELTVKSDPVADLPAVFNAEVHWTDENGRKRKGTFPGGMSISSGGGVQTALDYLSGNA